jgi:hypothetical protein
MISNLFQIHVDLSDDTVLPDDTSAQDQEQLWDPEDVPGYLGNDLVCTFTTVLLPQQNNNFGASYDISNVIKEPEMQEVLTHCAHAAPCSEEDTNESL